uniref:Small ribosomal subunit protein bS6 n=1 Tax=Caldisericum exile TaxID=693075 RepID=A0A7C4TXB1_9BACT
MPYKAEFYVREVKMNYYEVLYIVSANLSDEERQNLVQKFHDFVERNGGILKSENEWGIRELAYPIKKQDKGYYFLAYVDLNPSIVKDLYYFFKVTEGFLRAMIVKKEEKKEIEEVEENV